MARTPAGDADGRRPSDVARGRCPAARLLAAQPDDPVHRDDPCVHRGPGRALYRTPLGDRKPHAGGHWLKTLRGLDRARIWWARTSAAEEYEDALFSAFADGVDASPEAAPRLADRAVILPFANLQTATGVRKAHGITGAMEPAPPVVPVPGTTVVDVPEGAADGADESARVRPVEKRAPVARPVPPEPAVPGAAASQPAGGVALRGPAAREDLAALNDAVQTIACRRLVRELTVAEAAAELVAIGFLRATQGRAGVRPARATQGRGDRRRDPGPGPALDDPLHPQADLTVAGGVPAEPDGPSGPPGPRTWSGPDSASRTRR